MLPQIPQYHYKRCCQLLDKLPVQHPAVQKFLAATVAEDCPLSEPKHLRQAARLRQRALKWAAKRLAHKAFVKLPAKDIQQSREWYWQHFRQMKRMPWFENGGKILAGSLGELLAKLPRDNKPLPLPELQPCPSSQMQSLPPIAPVNSAAAPMLAALQRVEILLVKESQSPAHVIFRSALQSLLDDPRTQSKTAPLLSTTAAGTSTSKVIKQLNASESAGPR